MRPEFDKVRFRYEYAGQSFSVLSAEYGFNESELKDYAEANGWEIQYDPDFTKNDSVSSFYSRGRRHLTTAMTRRALTMFDTLAEIEDELISATYNTIAVMNANDQIACPSELSKLTKILISLRESSNIYTEAMLVPAMTDRELKDLLEKADPMGFKALCEMMKNRGIPIPDISVPDMEV